MYDILLQFFFLRILFFVESNKSRMFFCNDSNFLFCFCFEITQTKHIVRPLFCFHPGERICLIRGSLVGCLPYFRASIWQMVATPIGWRQDVCESPESSTRNIAFSAKLLRRIDNADMYCVEVHGTDAIEG